MNHTEPSFRDKTTYKTKQTTGIGIYSTKFIAILPVIISVHYFNMDLSARTVLIVAKDVAL